MRKTTHLHSFTMLLCLAAAAALGLELFLVSNGKTLCPTSSCEIVARYVIFGESVLLAMGVSFYLVLGGAIFFAGRYKSVKWLSFIPLLLLVGASSFDGALIGFQLTTIGKKCVICLGVAASLAVISILYASSIKRWGFAFLCITAWLAGFAANSILIMPDVTTANSGMVFYERPASKNNLQPTTATFIFSMECPHCSDVLNYLSEKNPNDTKWRFAITDSSKKSIGKLGHFYKNAAKTNNPFKLLLESKEKDAEIDSAILAKFPDLTRQTRIFLANNGIKGVPLLVIDTGSTTTFYKGSASILEYLEGVQ